MLLRLEWQWGFFPLVALALSGPEEALIRMWWCLEEHFSFMFILVLLRSGIYSGSCTGTQVTSVSPSSLSLGGILEGYSDCTLGGLRGKRGFNGEELSQGCHQVYPWCVPTPSQW